MTSPASASLSARLPADGVSSEIAKASSTATEILLFAPPPASVLGAAWVFPSVSVAEVSSPLGLIRVAWTILEPPPSAPESSPPAAVAAKLSKSMPEAVGSSSAAASRSSRLSASAASALSIICSRLSRLPSASNSSKVSACNALSSAPGARSAIRSALIKKTGWPAMMSDWPSLRVSSTTPPSEVSTDSPSNNASPACNNRRSPSAFTA